MSGVTGEAITLNRETLKRFAVPQHDGANDKDDRGRVLIIGGSRAVPGGALLAGTAALRAGAGKLQIATVDSVAVPMAIAMPEALVAGHAESKDGGFADAAIPDLCGRCDGIDAVVIGPGMRDGPAVAGLLRGVLAREAPVPLVVDAAALAASPHADAAFRAWRGGAVMLPHIGEMAALLQCDANEVDADRQAAARRAAERYRAVTLMKGPTSMIVAPDGETFSYSGGGVGLGTSGSGDTLAGIVGGLLARGMDPLGATLWGVWLHGEAGRRLAQQMGPVGFLAREIPALVPALLDGR
jgi:hydroxyethylthiazole kinase-like uncharacterized protein yjeF